MKPTELRDLEEKELKAKISEMESQLFDLRLQASMAKLQNHSEIRLTRKDIARAKTILQEKFGNSTAAAKPAEAEA